MRERGGGEERKEETFGLSCCSASDAFNFEPQGQPLTSVFTRGGTDAQTSPSASTSMRRTRLGCGLIGDYAGTMAATLSADEEQVGPVELFGFVFFLLASSFFFFLCHIACETPPAPPRPHLEVLWPCACCVLRTGGERRRCAACAAQWIRCETRAERKHCIDFWRFIAPVASLPVPLQRLSSS